MIFEAELWKDRVSVHIGDFTEAMFVHGRDEGTYITGLVTESEKGNFGFALLVYNIGIGIALRFTPGPWKPEEDEDLFDGK